jgi:hypothetical protein
MASCPRNPQVYTIHQALAEGLRLSKPQHCPDQYHEVLTACWAFEPGNRPNFSALTETLADLFVPRSAVPVETCRNNEVRAFRSKQTVVKNSFLLQIPCK